MSFRTILGGTLAIILISGAAPAGAEGGLSLPRIGLPKLFGGGEKPVQLAQSGDPRVTQLEEQVRQLSGTIEELNFQILQMQEQMRKMQEDNEFRFQEIEKGRKSDAGTDPETSIAAAAAAPATTTADEPAPASPAGGAETASASDPVTAGAEVIVEPKTAPGTPPKTFGTIVFDQKGNVTGGTAGDQIVEAPAGGEAVAALPSPADAPISDPNAAPASDGTVVAALPTSDDPEELYRNSYEFILSGDYPTAETGFRDHVSRFPDDTRAADARFWLGEALLGQKKYRDAAEVFLAANKEFPSAKKAPDMLLKLGVSLVGLNQREVACATFSEIGKRYPAAGGALKERVKQEQALAAC